MKNQDAEDMEPSEDQLLDAAGVCEKLKVGMTTFRKMVEEQRFPPPIRISQRVHRWRRETVLAWLREQEGPTPGPGRPRSGDK